MDRIQKIATLALCILTSYCMEAVEYDFKPYTLQKEGKILALNEQDSPPQIQENNIKDSEQQDMAHTPLIFGAGILVWKTRTTDSVYAISSTKEQFTLPFRSMLREVNFNYDLGYRFSLGWDSDHDDWTFQSAYTYLKANHTARTKSGMWGDLKAPNGFSQEVTQNILSGSGLSEITFQRAASCYDLKYRTLDAMIKKDFQVGMIGFTPQVGLEGSLLSSKQVNRYSGGNLLSDNTLRTELKDQYWGVGPKSALGMNWGLKRGFSIAQDLALSFMLGDLKTFYGEDLSHDLDVSTRLEGRDRLVVPHASYDIGLAYERESQGLFKHVHARLLFEGQYIWNFTQKVVAGDELDFGNLYLYGLTFELELNY